jgi:hypothetical protein
MRFLKYFLLLFLVLTKVYTQSSYLVTISNEDGNIYSINYGSFYVDIFAYKYPYGEEVLLKKNSYGGEICWKESNYDYYTGESIESYSECYLINQSYIGVSCDGCLAKGIGLDQVDEILKPTPLNDILPD